jgi:translation initiation factor IF-2
LTGTLSILILNIFREVVVMAIAEKTGQEVQEKRIEVPPTITVRDLAESMNISPIEIIKVLMSNGIMANINQVIDFDTVSIIGEDLGYEIVPPQVEEDDEEEEELELPLHRRLIAQENPDNLRSRPPVVTVLGHVDHGKTTLLDGIRKTSVVKGEAGGITQHIGAYKVFVGDKSITFLDTPGHAAFTAMRARGTQVTDLAILVVAADDGVMPQTREAVEHARAAQVPIIVALNKIDKANANPDKVKQELADVGLVIEDWGGDTICVPVSALEDQGVDDLLENILLVTDVSELQANPNRPAQGVVIEGRLDKRRGVLVTLLVQNGTLKTGDFIVTDKQYGRIRAMFNFNGKKIKKAGLSEPVSIMGLSEVPGAGDFF